MARWKKPDTRNQTERRDGGLPEMIDLFFFTFCRRVGVFYRRFLWDSFRRFREFYRQNLQGYFHRLDLVWHRLVKMFAVAKQHLFFHVYMFLKFWIEAFCVVRNGYNRYRGQKLHRRLVGALAAFCRGLKQNRRLLPAIGNYVLPIVMAVLFVSLVSCVFRMNFVVDVVDEQGQHIGYVKNEKVYDQAALSLENRILYQQGEDSLLRKTKLAVTIADPDEMMTADTLADTMLQQSGGDVLYGIGIWVDGKFLGAAEDAAPIEQKLGELLDEYRTDNPTEKVSFNKNITLSRGYYLRNNFQESNQILQVLLGEEEQDVYDTIRSGDTPILIAQRNEMSLDDLVALNPGVLDSCVVGNSVKVHNSKPFLPIKVTRQITYEENIPYTTDTYTSSAYWEGTRTVTKSGVNGKQSVTADVSYVDGIEVSREILSTTIISEPVTQQVAIGTKPMPKMGNITGANVSNYGLIRPIQARNYISQHYGNVGYSYGGVPHRGTDFATSYGTPVLAVLPGKVTFAGWNGTYGYQVKIDHGNGMVTTYAHNSKLNVSYGQTVAQGQVIAGAGSTGRSSGVHLHFELYINGVRQNPEKYLP